MVFRPSFFTKYDINTYSVFILFIFLFVAIISSSGMLIAVFISLIFLVIFYRLIVYRYGERVIIRDGDLLVRKFFLNPRVFNLSNIRHLSVVKLYRMYGSTYCIIINIDVKSQDKIKLTENNSFMLEGGWSNKEIMKLVDYIEDNNKNIDIEKTIQTDFWKVGSSLKRSIF